MGFFFFFFVAIQAFGIGTLTAPVNKMIEAKIPVIDMDTLIAPLDQIAVHSFLEPDNEFMCASVTQALVDAIGGKGNIIMTQGALGHTGAQGRARGFDSVVKKYPNIKILDTTPADWDVTRRRASGRRISPNIPTSTPRSSTTTTWRSPPIT